MTLSIYMKITGDRHFVSIHQELPHPDVRCVVKIFITNGPKDVEVLTLTDHNNWLIAHHLTGVEL